MASSLKTARRLRMLGWSTLLGLQSLFLLSPVLAQLNVGNQWPTPKVTSVFPPGGKAGSEVAVTVTGVDVDTPERAYAIAAEASAAPGRGGVPLNLTIEVRQVMSGPPPTDG